MQVILLKDVDHVGLRGDVVSVARGYARNFLLPRKLAEEATPARVAELEKRDAQRARHEAKTVEDAQAIATKLEKTVLRFEVKAGPTGSLFGSVTPTDIVDELWKRRRSASTGASSTPARSSGSAATRSRSASSRTFASRSRPRSFPRAASCRPRRSSRRWRQPSAPSTRGGRRGVARARGDPRRPTREGAEAEAAEAEAGAETEAETEAEAEPEWRADAEAALAEE